MSDTPADDMIPTPARVVKFWDDMERHTTHSAICWMYHPACALRRVYGELSSDIERRQHEIDRLNTELDKVLNDVRIVLMDSIGPGVGQMRSTGEARSRLNVTIADRRRQS